MSRNSLSKCLFASLAIAVVVGLACSASASTIVTYGYADIESKTTAGPASDGPSPFTTFSPTTGTVPNVSTLDYADVSQGHNVTLTEIGTLATKSGTPAILLNGAWQPNADSAVNSCWFKDNYSARTTSIFVMDLQSTISIAQINTYSLSFFASRAQQIYSVYGATMDNQDYSVDDGTWTLITDVSSTRHTVNGTNSLQGVSITDSTGVVGNYQYLLFAVSNSDGYASTFYGEIDVVKAVPEPASLSLLIVGMIGLLAYAWRKRK